MLDRRQTKEDLNESVYLYVRLFIDFNEKGYKMEEKGGKNEKKKKNARALIRLL